MVEAATVTIVQIGFPYHIWTPIAELRTPGPPLTGRSPTTERPAIPLAGRSPFPGSRRRPLGYKGRPSEPGAGAPLPLRIASWNINSLRLRLGNVTRLVETLSPDVLCLQEIKVQDEHFPHERLGELGYRHILAHGMKCYNGVAVLSRLPFSRPPRRAWCGREDCRHAIVELPGGIELHNFYVPAGGDVPDPQANPKFAHKLQFLEEMAAWFAAEPRPTENLVLVGDLNVAPLENDVWSHKQLLDVVCHTPGEVARLEALQRGLGWVDAVRHFIPPHERLSITLRQGSENAPRPKRIADIPNGPFHAAFLISRAYLARTWHEVIISRQFQQPRVEMNLIPAAFQNAAFEVVVQDDPGRSRPGLKSVHMAA